MQLTRLCAVYLIGLTGIFTPLVAQAQATPAEEDGVILDLDALDSLKRDADREAGHQAYIVTYESQSVDPAAEARADISRVAQAVKGTKARLSIVAYAPRADGESENDARRLALRRAIALRQILVAAGVDGSRVNLRPMGVHPGDSADNGNSNQAEIIVQQP